jgi:hypothetical protein
MIDSIRLRVPDPVGLVTTHWRQHLAHRDRGWARFTDKEVLHDVYLSMDTCGGKRNLMIEATLPTMLHGHNAAVLNVDEVQVALDEVAVRAGQVVSPFTLPPLTEWELSYVDWVWDWTVPSQRVYLEALVRSLNYPPKLQGKPTVTFDAAHGCQTLSFKSGGRLYRIYNKEEQIRTQVRRGKLAGDPAKQATASAAGRLRLEIRYERVALKKIYGPDCNVGRLMRHLRERPQEELYYEWLILASGWGMRQTGDALCKLAAASSLTPTRRAALYGVYLMSLHGSPRSDLEGLGLRRQTIWKYQRQLKGLGVKLGSFQSIPRLTIPFPDAWEVPEAEAYAATLTMAGGVRHSRPENPQ